MDFSFSQEQQTIREAINKICEQFDDQYWLEKDRNGGFPVELHQALAKDVEQRFQNGDEFAGAIKTYRLIG
jgi:acyl-CoA dehydrogenase